MGTMVRCGVCGAVLHSMYRHDFRKCSCKNETFVDGGFDYARVGGDDLNKIVFVKHTHDPDDITKVSIDAEEDERAKV